jgi:hypothetical protein
MSLITAISTVVGLDVLVLALLAYVMRIPFRISRGHTEPALIAAETARAAAERVAARARPVRGDARAPAARVGMPSAA